MEEKEHFFRITIDKHVFKSTFDDHFKALCSFAYRYVGDEAAAQDLVQEVFIGLWENRDEFDQMSHIKGFLYTSLRNKCLNHLKHRTVVDKHREHLLHELQSEEIFDRHVIEEDVFGQLYREIRLLPSSARSIMLLALKGLKNREIAEALGISENTVKTQKKIAYGKLKVKISGKILRVFLYL